MAPDFYQFLYMALGLSLILFALVFLGAPFGLNHLGLEPLVRKVALGYYAFLSLGIIPFYSLAWFAPSLMRLASRASPCISCFCSYLSMVSSISSSSMALLAYQSWVELGLVLELQWLIGPFSSFPFGYQKA